MLAARRWLKIPIFSLIFCALSGRAGVRLAQEDSQWRKATEQGNKLRQAARYAEAEQAYLTAVTEAEKFGPDDPRLASSLNNLGSLYHAQGRYVEGEKLY